MRLCDRDILKFLKEKRILITPKPPIERINGATVDICLGNQFRTFKGHTTPYIDISRSKNEINLTLDKIMNPEIILKSKNPFFLHPGELALAITLEKIALPNNIIGWLDGRSSLARLGLMIHVTAHRIDPGWDGKIVLEFYNSGKLPLVLRPGMIIGALSFEILSGPSMHPYNNRKNSKYKNQNKITIRKINEDKIN